MRPGRLHLALAAGGYLALALWSYRAVLPDPASLLPIVKSRLPDAPTRELYRSDRRFVVSVVAGGARRLLAGDLDLLDQSSCFPLARSGTLGEHMIGESLLGVVPYALSREPILTFNAVDVLFLVIAGFGMYALAFHWTRAPGAAFIAGFLFAFHPARLTNPAHPFAYGNLWTPLALLAAHRLVTRRRWRDAVLLSLALGLQTLESLYPLLGLAILGGTYGIYLLVRFRSALPALAPKLALVALSTGAIAWLVLVPYLETRATWGTLQGRSATVLLPLGAYLPGQSASPGLIPLVLAAVALVDRMRGARPRDGYDPRWVFTVGGLLVLWATLRNVEIGPLRWRDASPLLWLHGVIPGVDAVRVLASLRFGVFLVVAFLSAYGVQALTQRLHRRLRAGVGAALVLLVLAEALHPGIARRIYSWSPALDAEAERPGEDVIAIFDEAPPGAVLDLPAPRGAGDFSRTSRSVFLAAYHGRAVAACYNSFDSPIQGDVDALARRLPSRAASDALHALGFRVLVVHRRALRPSRREALRPLLDDPVRTTRLGRTLDVDVYALASWTAATEDLAALGPGDPPLEVSLRPGSFATVPFAIANLSHRTFRHPDPIEPRGVRVTWRDDRGRAVRAETITALLPIALAAGDQVTRKLAISTPDAPGEYRVTASFADDPEVVLAATRVRVESAEPGEKRRRRDDAPRPAALTSSSARAGRSPAALSSSRGRDRSRPGEE
jgi:hypothetical protein